MKAVAAVLHFIQSFLHSPALKNNPVHGDAGAGAVRAVIAVDQHFLIFGLSLLNVPGIVMSVIIGAMLIVVISLPIITRRVMQRRRI